MLQTKTYKFRSQQVAQRSKQSFYNKSMNYSELKLKRQATQFCKESRQNRHIIPRFGYNQTSKAIIQNIKQTLLKFRLQSFFRRVYEIQQNKEQLKKAEGSIIVVVDNDNDQKNKRLEEEQSEKVSCPFCDNLITFQEIQTHHSSCQMSLTCEHCNDIYPRIALNEHHKICQAVLKESQDAFEQRQDQKLQIEPKIENEEEIDELELISTQLVNQNREIDRNQSQLIRAQVQRTLYFQGQDSENNQQILANYLEDIDILYQDYPFQNYEENSQQNIFRGLKNPQMLNLVTDFYVKRDNNEIDECNICTKQKEEGQAIIRLPCFHVFHEDCLVPWLQVKRVCPNCKFNLNTAQIS